MPESASAAIAADDNNNDAAAAAENNKDEEEANDAQANENAVDEEEEDDNDNRSNSSSRRCCIARRGASEFKTNSIFVLAGKLPSENITALVIYFKPEWNIIYPVCTFLFSRASPRATAARRQQKR